MKCKDCECCKLGWFKFKPDKYVCTGVKEPFVINNIDKECSEYEDKKSKNKKWEEKVVRNIKDVGQSLIDNAERIVNNYKFVTDRGISIDIYDIDTFPYIEITNQFYPENLVERNS